jgi:hypothetical protein
MTDARIAAENRWDGPMPPEVIDRLRYGSATNAEIVRVEDSIAFFFGEIVRLRRSAKRWIERGNPIMARRNMRDVRLYRREWRVLRARLKDLRGTDATVKGAERFFNGLSPREPGDG